MESLITKSYRKKLKSLLGQTVWKLISKLLKKYYNPIFQVIWIACLTVPMKANFDDLLKNKANLKNARFI